MGDNSTDRGSATRQSLLNAAAELVPEVGWGAVTTRMVAERAGVNPALVHYHFSSVSGLLTRAALEQVEELAAGLAELIARSPDPDAGIDRLLGAIRPYTGTDPTSLLFTETVLAATRDEQLRRAVGGVLGRVRTELAGWLRMHGTPDPDATAAVLAAAVDGLILHRALDPSLDLTAQADALKHLVNGNGGTNDPEEPTTEEEP